MKNFDLNALGVTEMTQKNLMETNGGVGEPIPGLPGILNTIVQIAYYFYTIVIPEMTRQVCERAAKDDYVIWADLGHR